MSSFCWFIILVGLVCNKQWCCASAAVLMGMYVDVDVSVKREKKRKKIFLKKKDTTSAEEWSEKEKRVEGGNKKNGENGEMTFLYITISQRVEWEGVAPGKDTEKARRDLDYIQQKCYLSGLHPLINIIIPGLVHSSSSLTLLSLTFYHLLRLISI